MSTDAEKHLMKLNIIHDKSSQQFGNRREFFHPIKVVDDKLTADILKSKQMPVWTLLLAMNKGVCSAFTIVLEVPVGAVRLVRQIQ